MSRKLSRCGPGKFSLRVDMILYGFWMIDGTDDDLNDGHTAYGLFRCDLEPFDPIEVLVQAELDYVEFASDDIDYLTQDIVGAIISEDSNGFVSVEYFERGDEAGGQQDINLFVYDAQNPGRAAIG